MDNKRCVEKLMTVFELRDCRSFDLPDNASTRVMLIFDRNEAIKEFKVLNKTIPKNIHLEIMKWLQNNIDIYDVHYGLK